jgi:hypothetical protein
MEEVSLLDHHGVCVLSVFEAVASFYEIVYSHLTRDNIMLFVATLTSSKDIKARESRCP